jgi:ACS family allantoate permease-like MFS transporter
MVQMLTLESNIAGHTKKVTINSITLVSFAVGNIIGTQTFQAKQAPGYISGKISIVATLGALCFTIMVLRLYNVHLNKQNELKLAEISDEEQAELREKMAFADQTDRKNPCFRYTY